MTDSELISLRADENVLRKELEVLGARFRGRACNCPFHEDRNPSAGIYLKDSVWRFKCNGKCQFGGDIMDLRAKVNKRTVGDEFAAAYVKRPAPRQKTVYSTLERAASCYSNEVVYHRYERNGILHVVVIRYWDANKNGKEIRQISPYMNGFVLERLAQAPHPLYNLAAVIGAQTVIVTEGEKKADDLNSLGFVATTALGGAGKAAHTDWSSLAGKTVYLWADNDEPGVKHMQEVQKILCMLTPAPKLLRVKHEILGLEKGGDASDFIDRHDGSSAEDIKIALDMVLLDAAPMGVISEYFKYLDEGIEGRRVPIPLPWPMLSRAARALVPGTVTALCGDPGCGKSLMAMELMVAWSELDISCCIYELEDGRNYHLSRAHAQMCKESRLVDSEWLMMNPDLVRRLRSERYDHLEVLGRRIWEPPTGETATQQMLREWIEQRGRDGFKIIIVDPVTAARPDPKPWISDHELMSTAKRVAEQHECCVVLVVHPAKGHKGGGGMGEVSGGAAYTRLSHTVIWLDVFDGNSDELRILDKYGQPALGVPSVNRIARVVKSRNGTGRGIKIGMRLHGSTLGLEEIGTVVESS